LAVLSRSGKLPDVLTHLIDDVARRHGEVRVVAAGCCLRVPEPSLAADLLRARGLACQADHPTPKLWMASNAMSVLISLHSWIFQLPNLIISVRRDPFYIVQNAAVRRTA